MSLMHRRCMEVLFLALLIQPLPVVLVVASQIDTGDADVGVYEQDERGSSIRQRRGKRRTPFRTR